MFGVDHSESRAHLCSSADLHHTAAHHHHSRERPDKERTQLKIRDLTAEKKKQLQRDFESLNKKGSVCLFMSSELKSWSDSRQYCRDRGADLIIINTEEKQVSFERVWIGLSDIQQEGIMKWVDNSTLNQGFWLEGEPNNLDGTEDCVELNPENPILNNWNDLPCSGTINWICEK
uniref:C-type lectin domain-containing protein n=1 Tax=Sinocyclocheilus anshuiensis TaxID=1608454 RepID=A0A671Q602_9TELE